MNECALFSISLLLFAYIYVQKDCISFICIKICDRFFKILKINSATINITIFEFKQFYMFKGTAAFDLTHIISNFCYDYTNDNNTIFKIEKNPL